MTPRRNRRAEYVLTKDWPGEAERLHLLETVVDPLSTDAVLAAGIRAGMRCLEIGAGAGSMARRLAQLVGDPALVTAVDTDPQFLGPLADAGIQVLGRDILADEFPDGGFDLIHARAVLEHLPQRDEILARMASWLKPDGVAVIVDCASFPVDTARNPLFGTAMQAYVSVLAQTGTDYRWARGLPEPLQRCGYRDIGVATLVPTVQGGTAVARFWSLTLETVRERLVGSGLIDDAGIDAAQRLLADPDFFDLGPGFIAAWGRRPR